MTDVGVGVGAEAVAGWFDQHARALGAYAARRVGPQLARDIVGESFRVALQEIDRFDSARGTERAWLFGIATQLIRRHRRTEDRRLRIQARSTGLQLAPVDPMLRVEDRIDARCRYERVVDAVTALPADDRDLLFLVAWEEMSSRETADVLGIPAGTVRSRLHRIRAELARAVAEEAPDE